MTIIDKVLLLLILSVMVTAMGLFAMKLSEDETPDSEEEEAGSDLVNWIAWLIVLYGSLMMGGCVFWLFARLVRESEFPLAAIVFPLVFGCMGISLVRRTTRKIQDTGDQVQGPWESFLFWVHGHCIRWPQPLFQGKSGQALQRVEICLGRNKPHAESEKIFLLGKCPAKENRGLQGAVEVKGCPASTKEIYQELCSHLTRINRKSA